MLKIFAFIHNEIYELGSYSNDKELTSSPFLNLQNIKIYYSIGKHKISHYAKFSIRTNI